MSSTPFLPSAFSYLADVAANGQLPISAIRIFAQ